MKAKGWIDRIALAAMLATAASGAVVTTTMAAQGRADARFAMPDGVERRFFTSGPMGTTTYRVDVDAAGREIARVQVLNDAVFGEVREGATDAEIYATLGPPARKETFHRTRRTAWDYHYRDTWGYEAEFAVLFDTEGRVVGKFSTRDSG
jgi:outer membrane protein assembly factor BamE (lipoprotein component of BamABCDE complex)